MSDVKRWEPECYQYDTGEIRAGLSQRDNGQCVLHSDYAARVAGLESANAALTREVEGLREAARPFAEHWGEWIRARADHLHPDRCNEINPLWRNYQIVERNIMRLRTALAAIRARGAKKEQ